MTLKSGNHDFSYRKDDFFSRNIKTFKSLDKIIFYQHFQFHLTKHAYSLAFLIGPPFYFIRSFQELLNIK